ncbi:MAG: hypothetical protein ACLQSR_11665, partial [Limisphaerales bacterium]
MQIENRDLKRENRNTETENGRAAAPASTATLFGFINEITIEEDGWAMIAPFGDYPSEALLPTANGQLKRRRAIQRITPQSAAGMVTQFHNSRAGLKKFIRGCNIYVGHPDMPGLENRYPDKEPKGVFADMEVRGKGIYGLPVFTNEGMDLVEGRKLVNGQKVRGFSGRLIDAAPDGQVLADGQQVPVFIPTRLASAGLTPYLHLPVEFFNAENVLTEGELPRASRGRAPGAGAITNTNKGEQPHGACGRATGTVALPNTNQKPNQMKKKLLEVCTALGIQFANDADDAATEAALDQVQSKVDAFAQTSKTLKQKLFGLCQKAGIEFANEEAITDPAVALTQIEEKIESSKQKAESDLQAARTQFLNERAARITDELDRAITGGRITDAERSIWDHRLQAQFANEVAAIRALAP